MNLSPIKREVEYLSKETKLLFLYRLNSLLQIFKKKEENKNYTKEKTISISHQLIFERIICTTREFLISGLNTTSSKVDLYIPWNRPILGMIDALQSISNSLYQVGSKFIQLLANSMGYN